MNGPLSSLHCAIVRIYKTNVSILDPVARTWKLMLYVNNTSLSSHLLGHIFIYDKQCRMFRPKFIGTISKLSTSNIFHVNDNSVTIGGNSVVEMSCFKLNQRTDIDIKSLLYTRLSPPWSS